jgi:hypothetical protein
MYASNGENPMMISQIPERCPTRYLASSRNLAVKDICRTTQTCKSNIFLCSHLLVLVKISDGDRPVVGSGAHGSLEILYDSLLQGTIVA